MRRDTITVPANAYVVLRFQTDNPGMWAFHCHMGLSLIPVPDRLPSYLSSSKVAWHMEQGMLVQFLIRRDDLLQLLHKLSPDFMNKSLSFCPRSGDQAFGTEPKWKPPDLQPTVSIRGPKTLDGRLINLIDCESFLPCDLLTLFWILVLSYVLYFCSGCLLYSHFLVIAFQLYIKGFTSPPRSGRMYFCGDLKLLMNCHRP